MQSNGYSRSAAYPEQCCATQVTAAVWNSTFRTTCGEDGEQVACLLIFDASSLTSHPFSKSDLE